MKLGNGRWCVLKRSCHNKWTSSAWDFSEGHDPTLQNTFFRTNLSRKMQSRGRSAPGKMQQCAWAPSSFPRIADECFTLTQLCLTASHFCAQPSSHLHKNDSDSTLSHLKHTSSMSEHCFGYFFTLETRTKWNLEGPMCWMSLQIRTDTAV